MNENSFPRKPKLLRAAENACTLFHVERVVHDISHLCPHEMSATVSAPRGLKS